MQMCQHCQLNPAHSHGICTTCIKYQKRHAGASRPLTHIEKVSQRRRRARWCQTCGNPEIEAARRCKACYSYWHRTGKPRPRWLWDEDFCCIVCGFPKKAAHRKNRPGGGLKFWKGRCFACYGYFHKFKRDRPAYLWGRGTYGWCICGYPAEIGRAHV